MTNLKENLLQLLRTKELKSVMQRYFLELEEASSTKRRKVAWCSSIGPCELLMAMGFRGEVISMRTSARKKFGILILFLAIALYTVSGLSKAYAGDNIEVTLKNFYDVKFFHGNFSFSPMVEEGIPASQHILIVKSCHCLDNAKDKKGNEYYFYMVDQHNGLKALITSTKLDPVQKLDDKTIEFCEIVKSEIAKDGGLDTLIKKFKDKGNNQNKI